MLMETLLSKIKVGYLRFKPPVHISTRINRDMPGPCRGVVMLLILVGPQASKIILEPFCLKYWGGANPTFTIV